MSNDTDILFKVIAGRIIIKSEESILNTFCHSYVNDTKS